MKRVVPAIAIGAALLMAGCGGDNTTTFVLSSGTPTASASPSVTPAVSPSTSASIAGASPAAAATPIPNGLRIIIDSPDASSPITSPVEVSGTASVVGGAVLVVIQDASGTELGQATTTASAAKPDYGHYDISVTFSGATSGAKGQIRAMDAATHKNFYFISIRFS